jgi:hypothetical protein
MANFQASPAPEANPMPPPAPIQTTAEPRPSDNTALLAQTMGVIAAIAGITATRILLLLAVSGAFYLATQAISAQSTASLLVLVAYCAFTVLPLVALEWGGRRRLTP